MKETILIVEDERKIAEQLRDALAKEGYHAAVCATGEDALTRLGRGGIDLVLLDIGLPDGANEGLYLCREIRRRDRALPIVFLTAKTDDRDLLEGFAVGGDDYIRKPTSLHEITARVKAHLRRAREVRTAAPRAAGGGSISIDRERYEIRYHGTPVELTRTQFDLLELLASRPGTVFTRERLIDSVWGPGTNITERTVDVHVKFIRARLREIRPGTDPIETERGRGFRWREEA